MVYWNKPSILIGFGQLFQSIYQVYLPMPKQC